MDMHPVKIIMESVYNRLVQVTISIASAHQNDVTIYQNPITFGKERIITKVEEWRLESK